MITITKIVSLTQLQIITIYLRYGTHNNKLVLLRVDMHKRNFNFKNLLKTYSYFNKILETFKIVIFLYNLFDLDSEKFISSLFRRNHTVKLHILA